MYNAQIIIDRLKKSPHYFFNEDWVLLKYNYNAYSSDNNKNCLPTIFWHAHLSVVFPQIHTRLLKMKRSFLGSMEFVLKRF